MDIIWIFLFVAAIIILLIIEITFLDGWRYLSKVFRQKPILKETPSTTAPPPSIKKSIIINFKNKRIRFEGKEDLPEGKIGLYDENAQAKEIISYNQLRLSQDSIKKILEGKDDVIEFYVEDIDTYTQLQNEINAYKLTISRLNNDIINLSKSYYSQIEAIDKQRRKSWDILNKGKRGFLIPKRNIDNLQPADLENEEV